MRSLLTALAAAGALILAPSAQAVVGGHDAAPGAYPSVAEVSFGAFSCTGTLIAPTYVLTAGHCGSVTGAAVATPIAWPTPLIDVRIGSVTPGQGEQVPVRKATVSPSYLLGQGNDVTILELSRAASATPTPVAGASERGAWSAGTLATIAGFGVTEEGGEAPDTLQEAQVPIVEDATCAAEVDGFDATTMLCAGYPQGGVDTCQGDSGGPLFVRNAAGALRVAGATSFGEGCARPGKPGVYARVADAPLRTWIASVAPGGVAG